MEKINRGTEADSDDSRHTACFKICLLTYVGLVRQIVLVQAHLGRC